MKEDYDNVRNLLQQIRYSEYNWDVCGDFKMIGFLLGLQGGFTNAHVFDVCGTAGPLMSITIEYSGLHEKP